MELTKKNWNGYTVKNIHTSKFKTITFIVQLRAILDEKTVASRSLAATLLKKATLNHPSNQLLQKYLDNLYGARISSSVSRKGDLHQVSLQLTVLNPAFVDDEEYTLESVCQFLYELLYQPATEEGGFLSAEFTNERRNIEESIESMYNDKIQYSLQRLMEIMCANEPYSIRAYGKKEDYRLLTPKSVFDSYQKMLVDDEIQISIVGDIQELDIQSSFEEIFPQHLGKNGELRINHFPKVPEEKKVVVEYQDITQAKLNIGLRTNTFTGDLNYFALKVAIGILGGFPHSKLFLNVREKASLAYYASSYYDGTSGLAVIYAGIEPQNKEQAIAIINEQIKALQSGEFDDEDIEMTKLGMVNDILEAADSVGGMNSLLEALDTLPNIYSMNDWIDAIRQVNRSEIVIAAASLLIDTTYILTNEGASE